MPDDLLIAIRNDIEAMLYRWRVGSGDVDLQADAMMILLANAESDPALLRSILAACGQEVVGHYFGSLVVRPRGVVE